MSTSPYSIDLRERVIKFIEAGKSQTKTAATFNLHAATVARWYKRYKQEGHYRARKRLGARSKIDKKLFEAYIHQHSDVKIKELSKEFNLSIGGVHYWLKKLGYSYKKKPLPIWKQMKRRDRSI